MLRIRPAQFEALTALSRRRLVVGAAAHLRDEHPERWAEAPAYAVTEFVTKRLARGEELGLVEELSLLRYLEVASRYGDRFADSPDAIGVLHDQDALHDWTNTQQFLSVLHKAAA